MVLLKTLTKWGGIAALLLGTVFTLVGAYGLAGGKGITFMSAEGAGLIFSIVGIIVLIGGIAMTHIGFKPSRPNFLFMVLGLCFLIVPLLLGGMGYTLVAAIVAIVFGYSFAAMLFYWLISG